MNARLICKFRRGAATLLVSSIVFSNALWAGTDDTPQTPAAADRRDEVLYSDETESIKPLAIKLTRNILMDQKEIWTSPFHVNRHNAAWWLLFGGAAAALIESDGHLCQNEPLNASFQAIPLPSTIRCRRMAACTYARGATMTTPYSARLCLRCLQYFWK